MDTCPDCGSEMERIEGMDVSEPYAPAFQVRDEPLPRRIVKRNVLACSGCERIEVLWLGIRPLSPFLQKSS